MTNSPDKILLIDDNPDDIALMRLVFLQAFESVKILEVSDAVSFAEHLHSGGVGAVVCASRLAWGESLRVLEAVRRSCPRAALLITHLPGERHLATRLESLAPLAWVGKSSNGFLSLPEVLKYHTGSATRTSEYHELEVLRAMLAEHSAGLFNINQHGEITSADEAVASLLGHADAAALTGQSVESWADDSERALELRRQLPGLDGELYLNIGLRHLQGDILPVRVRICPLGPISNLASLHGDKSLAERQFLVVVQQNIAVGDGIPAPPSSEDPELRDLMHIVSHDLQDPLQLIERYAELLQQRHQPQLGDEASRYLQHLIHSADRMQDMIDGLLEYSRLDSSDFILQPVDLNEIVGEVVDNLQVRIDEHAAQVRVAHLPTVQGERRQLRQLFQNLIGNAIKFHQQREPVIEINASVSDEANVISIQDNGIGIDEHDLEVIFDMYRRLHTEEEFPGSGVGLALCRRIAERHGGRIEVSSHPGEGSRFDVLFPIRAHNHHSGQGRTRASG